MGRSTQRQVFPLLVLPVGDPKGYRDVLIKSVKAPAIAFRGREVPIDITVKSYGYTGLTLPVVLKEGNRVLAAKNGSNPRKPCGGNPFSLLYTGESGTAYASDLGSDSGRREPRFQ